MTITALPTPPTRQDPVNFSARADTFLAALTAFVTEANALQADVNSNQVAASSAAGTATSKAAEAAAARDIVMAAVNYKGDWSSLSGALNIPASVLYSGGIWMLTQNIASVAANTPGVAGCWLNVTPASGLGSAAYQNASAFQAAFGTLAGLVKANGAGGVSAASSADVLSLIGTTPVPNATIASSATTAGTANAIADGAVSTTAKIADRVITWAKHAAMTTGKLIGRSTAGGGDPEEISIGTGLNLSAGVLACTVTAPVASVGGNTGAVTNAQLRASVVSDLGYTPANGANYAPVTSVSSVAKYLDVYSNTVLRVTQANGSFYDIPLGYFTMSNGTGGG